MSYKLISQNIRYSTGKESTSGSSSSGKADGSRNAAVSTPSRRVDERVLGVVGGGMVDRQLASLSEK